MATTRLENVYDRIIDVSAQFDILFNKYKRPNTLERYWVTMAVGVTSLLYIHRTKTFPGLMREVREGIWSIRDTMQSFLQQWIVVPCLDIISTIREKEPRLAIMGNRSLVSDLASLERMVVSFAKDNCATISPELIESQVRAGDLSTVLQAYEEDLKTPGTLNIDAVRSFVAGSLIRSLLIQVQKVKVDGALAMSALDKLLTSNELNFAFLAFIPTLLISYTLATYLAGMLGNARRFGSGQEARRIKVTLRDIERLVLDDNRSSDEVVGHLLCHLVELDQVIRTSGVCHADRISLLEDVVDLEAAVLDSRKDILVVLTIIQRIHRFAI